MNLEFKLNCEPSFMSSIFNY